MAGVTGEALSPDAVVVLPSVGVDSAGAELDLDAWALLCQVDGHRSVGQVADRCGFGLESATQTLAGLVRSGLLIVVAGVATGGGDEGDVVVADAPEPPAVSVGYDIDFFATTPRPAGDADPTDTAGPADTAGARDTAGPADTASLLRELSSLGGNEANADERVAPSTPAPHATDQPARQPTRRTGGQPNPPSGRKRRGRFRRKA